MSADTSKKARYLNIGAAAVLVAGLGSALVIRLTAEKPGDDTMVFEYENSKMYARSLKLAGGQMAILADDFRRWFTGLWQGESLAYTVAVIAVIVSALLFWEARHIGKHS